jgi:hypothetical protein
MLQLAADLGFLDEALQHFGAALVGFQHHFDGDVAAQVGIAALEDGAHTAAGNLAHQLIPIREILRLRHLLGSGQIHRRGRVVIGLAQMHAPHAARRGSF